MKSLTLVIVIMVLLMCMAYTTGCTDNIRARMCGQEMKVELPPGVKLVNCTWKENSFWVLTKKMSTNDTPEVYTFTEYSSFNILQGKVTIKETR